MQLNHKNAKLKNKMPSNTENLISWNINSVKNKYPELQMLVQDYHPIVICLQETKPAEQNSFYLRNFDIHRKDMKSLVNQKGGVLIATHNTYFTEIIPLQTHLQVVAVKLYIESNKFVSICSIYLHSNNNINIQELNNVINQLPHPFIITGDFNGHNPMWGSQKIDIRGQIIEQFINQNSISLINSGKNTRFNAYNGTSSAIDLTLCSPSVCHRVVWDISNSTYQSDHHPQIISFTSGNKNKNK